MPNANCHNFTIGLTLLVCSCDLYQYFFIALTQKLAALKRPEQSRWREEKGRKRGGRADPRCAWWKSHNRRVNPMNNLLWTRAFLLCVLTILLCTISSGIFVFRLFHETRERPKKKNHVEKRHDVWVRRSVSRFFSTTHPHIHTSKQWANICSNRGMRAHKTKDTHTHTQALIHKIKNKIETKHKWTQNIWDPLHYYNVMHSFV